MIWWPWQAKHPALRAYQQSVRGLRGQEPAAVIDLEFDALDHRKARILSIAVVPVTDGWIDLGGLWHCYLQQPDTDTQSVAVHGLLQKQLSGGLPEAQALETFLQKISGKRLVGHGVDMDVRLLRYRMQQLGWGSFRPPTADTLRLARRLDGNREQPSGYYTLEACCARAQLPLLDEHTAPGDAYATALLWLKLRGGP
ncbi:MAG: hypothetical protein C0424_09225 [Sphingobacteriaceae bacterium]|nr:hypothetical protein [Sphingobacteriaceae bacterium]